MVDVDNLTDEELRTKLIEFGFPVMPITGTTRKLMLKKLKLLMDNKNKNKNAGRRSLGKFSSEEDSDTDSGAAAKAQKNRRITMAAPMGIPKKSALPVVKTIQVDLTEDEPPKRPKRNSTVFTSTTTTTKTSKIVKANAVPEEDFDTGSDSESDIAQALKKNEEPKPTSFNSSYTSSSSRYSPKKSVDSRVDSPGRSFIASKPSGYSSPITESASDRLNSIRSRLSLNNSGYVRPSFSTPIVEDPVIDKVETPFLSNFTKRLSTLSNIRNDYDYNKGDIKEHDTNGASNYLRSQYSSFRSKPRDYNYDYTKSTQSSVWKNNLVPFAVLAVAFLFFIFVAIMYLGIRSDSTLEPAGKNPYKV